MKTTTQPLQLGQIVMTRTIAEEFDNSKHLHKFIIQSIKRHKSCDWGDTNHHDAEMNDYAIKHKERILSTYNLPKHINIVGQSRIWIITEWDRSITTILFPSDY